MYTDEEGCEREAPPSIILSKTVGTSWWYPGKTDLTLLREDFRVPGPGNKDHTFFIFLVKRTVPKEKEVWILS